MCPTVCDPMACSPPDSSVHGIFQARKLEWDEMAFLTQGLNPCLLHLLHRQAGSLPLRHLGSPKDIGTFIIISSPDAFDVAWEADLRTTDLVDT